MSRFQFLHTADLHLDSPLRGLGRRRPDIAQLFRAASRTALANLIAAAIREQVAFVVIAGDLWDGDWQDFATGQHFALEMGRLARAGIPAFIARGNHDAASRITRALPLPDGVVQFGPGRVETHRLPELGVALHGYSFATQAVTENVALSFPAAEPGLVNIGVLHTALTGREGHASYAPCTLQDLLRTGYDYWALGHIHEREVVHRDPPVIFPGNLQGRHSREAGAKGATLVTVEDGAITAHRQLILDAARWLPTRLSINGLTGEDDLQPTLQAALAATVAAADGSPVATRVTVSGSGPVLTQLAARGAAVAEEFQAVAYAVSDSLLVEKVVLTEGQAEEFDRTAGDQEVSAVLATADMGAIRARAEALVAEIGRRMPAGTEQPAAEAAIAAARRLIAARMADPETPCAEGTDAD
ncbi:MAG: DNA repair exonuclease [Pseudomonadota bacterium]